MPASSTPRLHVVYCLDTVCHDYVVMDTQRKCSIHRMQCLEEHRRYQVATSSPNHSCYIHKVAAVPMLANDGVTIIGSMMLLQASREECERFIRSDPFFLNKIWDWSSVSITRFDEVGSALAPKLPSATPVPVRIANQFQEHANSA